MSRPARGQELELSVDDLAFGGAGVARHESFVVFVPHTAPGDRVRVRVRKARRRFAEADVLEVLTPGPDRVEPPCPYVPECGGCRLQHVDDGAVLDAKTRQVAEHLRRIGGIESPPLLEADPAIEPTGYRNKMEYSAGVGETIALGLHAAGRWDRVVDIERCLIARPEIDAVRETVRRWADEAGVAGYDRRGLNRDAPEGQAGQPGVLRNVVVREGAATGELMVTVVTSGGVSDRLDDLADRLWATHRGMVGLRSAVTDGVAETTQGLPTELVRGRDWFRERVGDVTLHLSADAFFQTNTGMTPTLYRRAAEAAGLDGGQTLYDLYSGAGAIGVALAGRVGRVIAIELSPDAARDAEQNARRNGVENHLSICGDVGRALRQLRGQLPAPDAVIVDPPRAGLSGRAVRRILELAPPVVAYVSCQPATLAENAARFVAGGYTLEWVRPVDMFPQTPHIEAVARFTKGS